jgi:glycosyltransferase involved in cell wall biosynthesis
MIKLSIIIPVFNVEDYLSECLDSILNQKYQDLEILLIDNNSTDNSLKIAKEYQKKFKKIVKVFKCETWGAAATRNFGVKKAKGKYLWFVDGDDYLEKGSIRKLITTAEKNDSDAVVMSVRRVYEDGHENILTAVNTKKKDWKKRYVMYGFPPFQNLYKASFWKKNFEFPEGMIHEDMAILSSVILYTDNISYVDKVLYNYRQRKNSVLHQEGWNPHSLDIFKALDVMLEKFKSTKKFDEYYSEIEYFFIWNLLIDSAKDFHNYAAGKEGQKRSREMFKSLFPNWRKNKYLKKKSLKFRINCRRGYFGLLK